jgi:hypothetical protein
MQHNVRWYGDVRDYEAISYQFTWTFFTSHKPLKTTKTLINYTMCVSPAWAYGSPDQRYGINSERRTGGHLAVSHLLDL